MGEMVELWNSLATWKVGLNRAEQRDGILNVTKMAMSGPHARLALVRTCMAFLVGRP